MQRDARIPIIEVLEMAASENGLPRELIAGENVYDVSLYHDLIDQGYLMGTILSDGKRPYFIEGCHITTKGREYLMQLKGNVREKPPFWSGTFKYTLIGFIIGTTIGLVFTLWWIRKFGMPGWMN